MSRQNRIIAIVAVLALTAGFALAKWLGRPAPMEPSAAEMLLSMPLHDLQGRSQSLAQYRGKILIVNFWATWCPPCREEIPVFIDTQNKFGSNGIQFVGIAIDNADKVTEFAQEIGINYPILIGGFNETEILRNLGNPGGGLPYTLIYDRNGNLTEQILGGLDKTRIERMLASLI